MLEIDGTTKNSLPVNKKDGSILGPGSIIIIIIIIIIITRKVGR